MSGRRRNLRLTDQKVKSVAEKSHRFRCPSQQHTKGKKIESRRCLQADSLRSHQLPNTSPKWTLISLLGLFFLNYCTIFFRSPGRRKEKPPPFLQLNEYIYIYSNYIYMYKINMFKRGMVRPTGCNLCFLSPLKVFYFFKEKLFDFRLGIRLNKKRER